MKSVTALLNESLVMVVGAGCIVLGGCGTSTSGQTSPDAGGDRGGPATDAPAGSKRVFVTSTAYSGNLGGSAGADALCVASSDAVGLGGNWRAWISTGASDAFTHLDDVSPWYRLDGAMAFPNKAALRTTPAVPLTITEQGMMWVGYVWTGTLTGAIHSTDDCSGFTSASTTVVGTAGVVRAGDTSEWTTFESHPCQMTHPIYCFEQ